MVVVSIAQAIEGLRVVANNHSVHSVSDRYLPSIVLAHSVGRTTLNYGSPFRVLASDGLPSERAQCVANGTSVVGSF